ncbi:CotH kinase family protein [Flavobacterium aquicola]|uniref:Putative secreted protein (Por secretion system target) n=1 Tax=Flavobacterium aquicola TaxID=1682742 RepID=A0A3E0EA01_9FLAO|nr:CotH kinase family protein [Flavobacterium aquicola]REG94089.1 putative secreted protein (Por secretion system target) [Flavobacterium aquicola]
MFKIKTLNFSTLFQFFFVMLLISSGEIHSQTFTDSNLPIVVINTDLDPNTNLPLEILDDPKILAAMKIINRPDGSRNFLTDVNTAEYLNYDGRIGIELRGSTSQLLPKKPYGLTTLKADNKSNNNVSILGMPAENDWVLNSFAYDPSFMRDFLSYNLARQIGDYASRTVYCEVVINGEYLGLYAMQEKLKTNSERINILKISSSDVSLPNVTGGYITKADKTTGGDPIAWSMFSTAGWVDFIHELPKPTAVTPEQNTYIHNEFLKLESSATNPDFIAGYPSVIDVPSFVDFMLLNEFASNVDSYQYSTYFHKDRNGKLRAGPIWDFNLTYGNDLFEWGYDRSKSDVWQFANGDNVGPRFWSDLFTDSNFKCYLSKRWNELSQTGMPFNYSSLEQNIDNTVSYITEAKNRDNIKWGALRDFTTEIAGIKTYLSARISWITSNLGSFSSCSAVQVPSLVINKINYNPAISTGFSVSDDLEFIEIVNTGNTTVDLTGVYLKELGITYQFPASSIVLAGASIFLASNTVTFQNKYGIPASGQFTRNLSNSSQKLVLADGFGNTIDSVEYSDASPWVTEADGNGSYLKLISTDLDNSLASSWIAKNDTSLSTSSFLKSAVIEVYPNPVTNVLTVHTSKPIAGIKIYSVLGILLDDMKQKSENTQVDLSKYTNGVYFIAVYDENGSVTQKIIKQ